MNQLKLKRELKIVNKRFMEIYERGNISMEELMNIEKKMKLLKSLVDDL